MLVNLAAFRFEWTLDSMTPGLAAWYLQDADMVLSNGFMAGFFLVILLAMCAGALIGWMILRPARNRSEEEPLTGWQFDHAPVALWEEDWSAVLAALPEGWSLEGATEQQLKTSSDAVKSGLGKLSVRSINRSAVRLLGISEIEHAENLLRSAYRELSIDNVRQLLHELTDEPNAAFLSFPVENSAGEAVDIHVRWQATPGSEHSLASVMVAAEPARTCR